MKTITGTINAAVNTLSRTVASCCGWSAEESHHAFPEKSYIYDDQPQPQPQPPFASPPLVEPMRYTRGIPPPREQASGKSPKSLRSGFLKKKRLFPIQQKSRRPQISGPSDFRHLTSGGPSFSDFDGAQPRCRPRSFRPLELSIYRSNNRLSSMMPYFGGHSSPPVTPPNRAIVTSSDSDDDFLLRSKPSSSSLSFSIPRKPANVSSIRSSPLSDVIQPPVPAHLKTYFSPAGQSAEMNDLIERVATAMLERDILQEQIDDAIERQSVYVSSRPSSIIRHKRSTARSVRSLLDVDMEPMPEVPALPPNAPSFSERLSIDRPQTAPVKDVLRNAPSIQPFHHAQTAYRPPQNTHRARGHTPPPPPLPLRLRPPLRKKKSFSRVSSWLGFPAETNQSQSANVHSITTQPLPVQRDGGFYEVVAPARKTSFDSDVTATNWTSDDEKAEQQTVPTSWSPSSSSTVRPLDAGRPIMLGQAPWRESVVGVAF